MSVSLEMNEIESGKIVKLFLFVISIVGCLSGFFYLIELKLSFSANKMSQSVRKFLKIKFFP